MKMKIKIVSIIVIMNKERDVIYFSTVSVSISDLRDNLHINIIFH